MWTQLRCVAYSVSDCPLQNAQVIVSDSPQAVENSRFGLRLFAVYTAFYAGFVLVNAFAAEWGDWIVFAGLNLAVVWGFALIVLAFVLALFYGIACKPDVNVSKDQAATADQNVGDDSGAEQ